MELELRVEQYLELDNIGVGVFAPLAGFMTETEFNSVVDHMELPNGAPFPIPIILDIGKDKIGPALNAAEIILTYQGEMVGGLIPESIYHCDKEKVCAKVYGTTDPAHPGVRMFKNLEPAFIGGAVRLTKRFPTLYPELELTPKETRAAFRDKGWSTVVGFQTRNVPHRAHEYLQRVALEHVDGLFIQPLIGKKKPGDFTPEAVIRGYRALIDHAFRPDKVQLGTLTTSMRYAGPREAVFHAIIRRNYGCTHFIVGRDHAGAGGFYEKYEAHDMTRRFDGKLGIEIMRLHGPFHCSICDGIVTEHTCPHGKLGVIEEISGSDMRRIIQSGELPPPHLMRRQVIEAIRNIEPFIGEDAI